MADNIVTVDGANGLPKDLANLGPTSVLPVSVDNGGGVLELVGATIAQLLAAFGNIGASGDVTVAGHIGALAFTIANGAVTLSKMASLPANSVIGTAVAGAPGALTIGSGLHIAGGDTLVADAVAAVQPTLNLLVYRTNPGAL